MVNVNFYETVNDPLFKFAVIIAKTGGKWVLCKHRARTTYEFPGGHREPGERILIPPNGNYMKKPGQPTLRSPRYAHIP